jgi:hypothetical protein
MSEDTFSVALARGSGRRGRALRGSAVAVRVVLESLVAKERNPHCIGNIAK